MHSNIHFCAELLSQILGFVGVVGWSQTIPTQPLTDSPFLWDMEKIEGRREDCWVKLIEVP